MGTVSKALSLLGYFSRTRSQIGLSEMARLSGQNKATVFRLMTELAEQGFVEKIESERSYRLGPVFPRFAALRDAAVPMRDVAQKVARQLSESTGETAHVSLVEGEVLRVISFAYCNRHGTRVTMEDAQTIAFHSTGSGQVVMAYSPQDIVDDVLSRPLEKMTPFTPTDPDQIRLGLADLRKQGFAETVSTQQMDVHSHASPIFDSGQHCFGSVAVAAPVARMTPELSQMIRNETRRAALDLTHLLGGFAPDDFKNIVEAIGSTPTDNI